MPQVINSERVRTIVAEVLEVSPDLIAGATNFMDDLGADSLRVIEIIARLEGETGMTIDQTQAASLVSLDAICDVAGLARLGA